MATAFSQAALAEAKRAMDKAQAKFDTALAATKAARQKVDDFMNEMNRASRLMTEAQVAANDLRKNEYPLYKELDEAKANYEKMLALSRQQG